MLILQPPANYLPLQKAGERVYQELSSLFLLKLARPHIAGGEFHWDAIPAANNTGLPLGHRTGLRCDIAASKKALVGEDGPGRKVPSCVHETLFYW